jgi:uncharacterized membrane protein
MPVTAPSGLDAGAEEVGDTSTHRIQLVTIGYPETYLASVAMDQLESLRRDSVLRRDEIAAVVRDERGSFRIETNAEIAPDGPSWTMLWLFLFASFFFVPVLKMPVGEGVASLLRDVDRAGLDEEFVRRVRGMVVPGTSALFVLASKVSPDEIVASLEGYGGTVLQCEISAEAEHVLLDVLAGGSGTTPVAADAPA